MRPADQQQLSPVGGLALLETNPYRSNQSKGPSDSFSKIADADETASAKITNEEAMESVD